MSVSPLSFFDAYDADAIKKCNVVIVCFLRDKCIVDFRSLKADTDLKVEEITKHLLDHHDDYIIMGRPLFGWDNWVIGRVMERLTDYRAVGPEIDAKILSEIQKIDEFAHLYNVMRIWRI